MTLPNPSTSSSINPTVLLSHLTSRPSVLSTLILSRKDGSIIRCTGQLAPYSPDTITSPSSPPINDGITSSEPELAAGIGEKRNGNHTPTPAQKLARCVFDHVATASNLAGAVHALDNVDNESIDGTTSTSLARRLAAAKLSGETTRTDETGSAEGNEMEDGEKEVKLLRLRTERREIVVVVEKKWLLVVVNSVDAEKGKGATV
jgi:hypothetical protein